MNCSRITDITTSDVLALLFQVLSEERIYFSFTYIHHDIWFFFTNFIQNKNVVYNNFVVMVFYKGRLFKNLIINRENLEKKNFIY